MDLENQGWSPSSGLMAKTETSQNLFLLTEEHESLFLPYTHH